MRLAVGVSLTRIWRDNLQAWLPGPRRSPTQAITIAIEATRPLLAELISIAGWAKLVATGCPVFGLPKSITCRRRIQPSWRQVEYLGNRVTVAPSLAVYSKSLRPSDQDDGGDTDRRRVPDRMASDPAPRRLCRLVRRRHSSGRRRDRPQPRRRTMAALSMQPRHGVGRGVSSTAISTILAHWFDLHRGLALSLAPTGASVGGFAVAPVLLTLSQRHGLAAAVPKVVLSLLVVIVPLIWIGIPWRADRRPPLVETTVGPRAPAITGRNEVLQDAQFWSVAAPFALALDAPRRHVGGRRRDRPARQARGARSDQDCRAHLAW